MKLAFHVIGKSLSLKDENVNNVMIGSNPIMGHGNFFFLKRNLITHLHEKCIFTLHKIMDTNTTNVW